MKAIQEKCHTNYIRYLRFYLFKGGLFYFFLMLILKANKIRCNYIEIEDL